MQRDIREIVRAVHDAPAMAVLAVAGAGSRALAWLLGVPGASRTVLEASVLYSSRAMAEYLGWDPEKHAAPETAVSLAAAAHARARRFRSGDEMVFGISCAATIVTDRPKRGLHRCHVGVWGGKTVRVYSLVMHKGLRDRDGEEEVVSRLVLSAVAAAYGIATKGLLPLAEGETVRVVEEPVEHPIERLLGGQVSRLTVYGPETMAADEPLQGQAVLPGSFNPLHIGHLALARVAEERLGKPVIFEISTHNVDKPPLTDDEIRARLEQFADGRRRVVLTREPLYAGKAALLPGSTFVIGFDTARRLVDPAYYHDNPDEMRAALKSIREAGCDFLVAGRALGERFRTLDDLDIPAGFEDMFEAIPEQAFRVDISSTALREHGFKAE